MREQKDGRAKQEPSVAEAAERVGASESVSNRRRWPEIGFGDEDDLTRLIRLIARQAAQEAFSIFRDAQDRPAVGEPTLLDPLEHAPKGHAGKDRAPPEPNERFLSVAIVADRLELSEKTVRRAIASGDLPAHRVGKLIRVSEGDFRAYFTQRRSQNNREE
jgi:excisionase family DNA binding protein